MQLLGKIALGVTATALVGTAALCSEGLVHVRVVEKRPEGHHIWLVAPALVIPIAVRLLPNGVLAAPSHEIKPWLPLVRTSVSALRDAEDMVFVEATDSDSHVRIAKEGGSIVVDVDDRENTVHVSAPLRSVNDTVLALDAAY